MTYEELMQLPAPQLTKTYPEIKNLCRALDLPVTVNHLQNDAIGVGIQRYMHQPWTDNGVQIGRAVYVFDGKIFAVSFQAHWNGQESFRFVRDYELLHKVRGFIWSHLVPPHPHMVCFFDAADQMVDLTPFRDLATVKED